MKKTKLEKGITLVALIITIVVLLILAVVSIGAIKNSGIIGHAQESANKNTVAQENEQIILALNEWKLQKNTPNNTTSFKAVIEAALQNEEVTIEGEENGPLTVKFSKTGNKYKVTKDGTISSIANLEGTQLEKYIFGDDLTGRNLTEIMPDMESMEFTNTSVVAVSLNVQNLLEPNVLYVFYIKYDEEIYKFKLIFNNNSNKFTTEPSYGLTKIVIDTENTRVGKTVSYDNNTWTIMYDDDTNGLQMICNETYKYNNNNFRLGFNDSSITNWNSLITTADLDNDGSLNNLEKTIYSYNNAITTLNTTCENLFKNNESNTFKNSNIEDVRCVGSNPNKNSKDSENTTPYTSENLAKWPENNTAYVAGIGNGKGKSTDLNYVTDFDRMVALGINIIDTDYWMASRLVSEHSDYVGFGVRYGSSAGSCFDSGLWEIKDSTTSDFIMGCGLRPVVSLSSTIQLTPSQSGSTTDYVLN